MWIGQVSAQELMAAGRWTVGFFSSEAASHSSAYPMCPLRQVAEVRRSMTDPCAIMQEQVNYLSLEHVRSDTGELVDFKPRPPSEVKSRSKVFLEDDVLFGRLRPELNKVYLAKGEVSSGICSNEFIVLRAVPERIHPRYLRHVLASSYVTRFAAKLRTGASLPRMGVADLLSLSIPLPPLDVQEEIARDLARLDEKLRAMRQKLQRMPADVMGALALSLQHGRNELKELGKDLAGSSD